MTMMILQCNTLKPFVRTIKFISANLIKNSSLQIDQNDSVISVEDLPFKPMSGISGKHCIDMDKIKKVIFPGGAQLSSVQDRSQSQT